MAGAAATVTTHFDPANVASPRPQVIAAPRNDEFDFLEEGADWSLKEFHQLVSNWDDFGFSDEKNDWAVDSNLSSYERGVAVAQERWATQASLWTWGNVELDAAKLLESGSPADAMKAILMLSRLQSLDPSYDLGLGLEVAAGIAGTAKAQRAARLEFVDAFRSTFAAYKSQHRPALEPGAAVDQPQANTDMGVSNQSEARQMSAIADDSAASPSEVSAPWVQSQRLAKLVRAANDPIQSGVSRIDDVALTSRLVTSLSTWRGGDNGMDFDVIAPGPTRAGLAGDATNLKWITDLRNARATRDFLNPLQTGMPSIDALSQPSRMLTWYATHPALVQRTEPFSALIRRMVEPRTLNALGWVSNSVNTSVGVLAGELSLLGGGRRRGFGNNALEYEHVPLIQSSITLGNVVLFAAREENPGSADPAGDVVRKDGPEERNHTYQGEMLGVAYFPLHIFAGVLGMLGPHQGNTPWFQDFMSGPGLNAAWHGSWNFMENGPGLRYTPTPFPRQIGIGSPDGYLGYVPYNIPDGH